MTETTTTPDPREAAWLQFPNDVLELPFETTPQASRCRSRQCQAMVWWSVTKKGKAAPFDIRPDGSFTGTLHHRTCLDRQQFSKKR